MKRRLRTIGFAALLALGVSVCLWRPADATGADGGGQVGKSPAAAPPLDSAAATAQRLAALRKKILADKDFFENEETNRDPFHSYLRLFVDKLSIKTRKVQAIFDKYGLEELVLIAVVSGDENPRAMFRDSLGLGQTIKQGDFISKSGARVTKILSDRVIVEQTESGPNGETRAVEKAILVNPEDPSR